MIAAIALAIAVVGVVAGTIAIRRLKALGRQHFDAFVRECQVSTEHAVQLQAQARRLAVMADALDGLIVEATEHGDWIRRLASLTPAGIESLSLPDGVNEALGRGIYGAGESAPAA